MKIYYYIDWSFYAVFAIELTEDEYHKYKDAGYSIFETEEEALEEFNLD